jgi:hypothetical protein
VKLEFGSLTDRRPAGRHPAAPWIAEALPATFGDWRCEVVALQVERTFWEKATILHAESLALADPRASCFCARRCLELAVQWLYKHDPALRLPHQDSLRALIHEPAFRNAVGDAVFNEAQVITRLGNGAVHRYGPIRQYDAVMAVKELFHIACWLARTYARGARPAAGLAFDKARLRQSLQGAGTATGPGSLCSGRSPRPDGAAATISARSRDGHRSGLRMSGANPAPR